MLSNSCGVFAIFTQNVPTLKGIEKGGYLSANQRKRRRLDRYLSLWLLRRHTMSATDANELLYRMFDFRRGMSSVQCKS